MKKILSLLTIIWLSSLLFALDIKSYITGAYNYGVFTERAENAKTKIKTNAIDLSISSYFNENWGMYLNTDYNFPTEATVISGGTSITTTSSDWDFSMILSAIIGPTYKYSINDKLDLFTAIGFHIAQYSIRTDYSAGYNFSFGLGGDLGIRYLPTKNFYLTAGCLLSHDFGCNGKFAVSGYGETTTSGAYNLGSIRPYVGIGFTFNESLK